MFSTRSHSLCIWDRFSRRESMGLLFRDAFCFSARLSLWISCCRGERRSGERGFTFRNVLFMKWQADNFFFYGSKGFLLGGCGGEGERQHTHAHVSGRSAPSVRFMVAMIVGETRREPVFHEQVTVGARQIRFRILDCEVNPATSGCVAMPNCVQSQSSSPGCNFRDKCVS